MSDTLTLEAQPREVVGKKVKRLRLEGIMPATVYGKDVDPVSIQVDERAFNLVYRHAGRTSLVDLEIPGQRKQSAFIHAIQRHPISRSIVHADFWVVNLRQKMQVEVPIVLTGESPLVQKGDAVLNQSLQTLAIVALPAEVPQHVEVDISDLNSLEKNVYVRDMITTGNYEVITDAEEMVVSLTQTRAALATEDEEAAEDVGAQDEPELIREDRDDDTAGDES